MKSFHPPRRSLRRIPAALATVAVLAAAATTFGASVAEAAGPATTAAKASGTLNWASSFAPSSWDPVVDGSGAAFRITSLAYASLTTTNTKGQAVPNLAKSWTYNKAGTQVSFHLRSNLKFDDGSALDSAAVKAYILRAQTQKNSALVGEGIAPIASITTPDKLTVVLHLSQPDFQLPLVLAERVGQITSPTKTTAELNILPDGAGPFKPVSIVPGAHAIFVKNPAYWDAKDIHIAKVEVFFGVDPSSVVSGLETGVYNFSDLGASQVKAAKAAGLDVIFQPGFNAANLSVNRALAPFTNPKVLEAINYAINRKQIVSQIDFGYGKATDQPFPPGYIAYDPKSANLYPYNPAKAKALLAAAGYQPGQLTVPFVVSSDSPENELIQAQLKAVGITATLQVETNWATSFFAKKLALSTYGTTGRDSPIQTLQAHFGPQGALNSSGLSGGPAFDAAIAKALATPLNSPKYAANIQAATRAGLATTGLVFTDSLPNIFVKTSAVSALPKIPAYVVWTGVTISGN